MHAWFGEWRSRWFPESPPPPTRWHAIVDKLIAGSREGLGADESGSVAQQPTYVRHYRVPRSGVRFLRGYMAFLGMVGILIVTDNQGGIPTPLVAVVYFGSILALWLWGEQLMVRGGMYESVEGLTLVQYTRALLVPWERIAGFEHSKTTPKSRVLVRMGNGNVIRVRGAAQGARTTWSDGETDDIVGVLNARLQTWTATLPAAGVTR